MNHFYFDLELVKIQYQLGRGNIKFITFHSDLNNPVLSVYV